MKITVLCVGKIKKKFLSDAVDDYKRRLSSHAQVNIIEVSDEKTPDGASETVEKQIREKEGKRLLEKMPKDAYVIALAIDGKKLSSEHFSEKIEELTVSGVSHIVFVIGGSIGLADEVLRSADMKLSFSDMTFPHQLMRVILMEQIYRAFKIIKNEPYHK
ncbi:MAG: 23S rRNA (pseudouridine(1915)-N(3))-methyltransferase RlmH [Eubacterium sp.]|nr:23S rRNA (pseudouridine(1915)-N(3))-methyltransferase RlmH [Eubacterium sp.]